MGVSGGRKNEIKNKKVEETPNEIFIKQIKIPVIEPSCNEIHLKRSYTSKYTLRPTSVSL